MLYLLICSFCKGQTAEPEWYSENTSNGVIIQNSFPNGGPYTGPATENFNYSYQVFFTRLVNETENLLELILKYSADSIAIPNSTDTFVKLFLPLDTMSPDKQNLFS